MITLGIETSCDETSVAVLKGKSRILSNITLSSLAEHKKFGGVVPEIASRSHLESVLQCLDAALKKARVPLKRVDLVAVTQGPGLMGSLLVGISAAKALSLALKKPLVGVDHVLAHIYAAFLSERTLRFPCLGLVVSGGHTLLLDMRSASKCEVVGTTIDDAVGEAFDKVAKILGLGYPGGPEIDRLSRGQDPNRFFFTRPYLSTDSLNFSFSGIKTAVLYQAEKLKAKGRLTASAKKGISAGFQEAVCETLVQKSVKAAKRRGLRCIVVGGGVSANSLLRRKFDRVSQNGLRVVFPPGALCQDNAAMIAGFGAALHREGRRDSLDMAAYSDFKQRSHGNQA